MNEVKSLDKTTVDELLNNRDWKVLRFDERIPDQNFWIKLNQYVLERRSDFEVFLHWDKGAWKDLSFLKFLPNLKKLHINSNDVSDISPVKDLINLQSLRISSINLLRLEPLSQLSQLKCLHLGATNVDASLSFLKKIKSLNKISIAGEKKDLESLSKIEIEDLRLEDMDIKDLSFLTKIKGLKKLGICDCRIERFDAISKLESLEELELDSIEVIDSLEFIADLKRLKRLFLSNLKDIQSLPSLKNCQHLIQLNLSSMMSLDDISAIKDVRMLEKFIIEEGTNLLLSDIFVLSELPNLKEVSIQIIGDIKKRNAFDQYIGSLGLKIM